MAEFNRDFVRRLHSALDASDNFLKPYRAERVQAINRFVGPHYGRSKSQPQPINVDHLAISVLMPIIVGGAPQCKITAKPPALRPAAKTFELATNHVLREMELLKTYTMCALDALFMAAFTKCSLTAAEQHEIQGILHDAGMPYVDRLDFDDIILDSNAKEWEGQRFCGNRFRMPLEKAKEIYQNVDKLTASYPAYGTQGRAEEVGAGKRQSIHELEDYVELIEIWLARENVILTIPAEEFMGTEPLAVIPYQGPERGPYNMLSFMPVSDNLLPLAPSAVWKDSATLINSLARKLKRQADRSKNIALYPKIQQDDARAIRDADDGEMIGVSSTDTIKALTLGGADATSVATLDYFLRLNSKQAGNIDLLGGLQATGSTATEAADQAAAATGRVNWYKRCMRELVTQDIRGVAFYTFTDPMVQIQVEKVIQLPDGPVPIPEIFSAETREGDFTDYNFEVDAASIQPKSAAEKAAAFVNMLTGVLPAIMPSAQAQGMVLNAQTVAERAGELMGVDDIDAWFIYLTPEQQAQAAANTPQVIGRPAMQPQQAGTRIAVNGGGRGVGGTKPPMPAKPGMPMAQEPQEAIA